MFGARSVAAGLAPDIDSAQLVSKLSWAASYSTVHDTEVAAILTGRAALFAQKQDSAIADLDRYYLLAT